MLFGREREKHRNTDGGEKKGKEENERRRDNTTKRTHMMMIGDRFVSCSKQSSSSSLPPLIHNNLLLPVCLLIHEEVSRIVCATVSHPLSESENPTDGPGNRGLADCNFLSLCPSTSKILNPIRLMTRSLMFFSPKRLHSVIYKSSG